MSAYMDYTPRRLIAMTRAGCREDVLGSMAIWVCTSCYSCTLECPKRIPITEIVHGLRRIAIEENLYPKRFSTPVMTREFVSMIQKRGRSTESWISLKLYLKTRPIQLLKYAFLAIGLMRRGRLSVGRESIRDPGQITTMLRALEAPSVAPAKDLIAVGAEVA
jgi:heterodisulfide reductase subunit C